MANTIDGPSSINPKAIVPASIDDFFQNSPIGSIENAIGNNFYGLNHQQQPNAVPMNKDNYGYTFFTRPQLNFQTRNIRNVRIFTPLLTNNPVSIQRIIRMTLDPRLAHDINTATKAGETTVIDRPYDPPMSCPFVDTNQIFIPMLTNQLKTLTGWPDISLDTNTSKPGPYKEAHAMIDDTSINYTAYDLEATFRNTKSDPILFLFYAWVHYSSLVFEGKLMPYPDFIVENELDYCTRIWRIILDPSKKRVQKIAATGASFPTSLPFGAYFDYNNEKPINDSNLDITIRFKCMGAQYQDDILIYEFNKAVAIFHPGMKTENLKDMVKIPDSLRNLFNHRGYPRIDPETYELEWYVDYEDWTKKVNALNKFENSLGTSFS